jgi:Tfp pilus assembly protein PilE
MMMRRLKKCASGVTLIEVLVAALLCAICTAGIVAVPIFSERTEQRGDLTSIAYQFASGCLDYLKNKAYEDYSDSDFLNPDSSPYLITKLSPIPQELSNLNGAGTYTVDFYPSGTQPNETGKCITVTITWTEPEAGTKEVILTTLIAKLQ